MWHTKFRKKLKHKFLNLIRLASKVTGKNNIVISGGYGLNCVANYCQYLKN